jgi:hypothetical protein
MRYNNFSPARYLAMRANRNVGHDSPARKVRKKYPTALCYKRRLNPKSEHRIFEYQVMVNARVIGRGGNARQAWDDALRYTFADALLT